MTLHLRKLGMAACLALTVSWISACGGNTPGTAPEDSETLDTQSETVETASDTGSETVETASDTGSETVEMASDTVSETVEMASDTGSETVETASDTVSETVDTAPNLARVSGTVSLSGAAAADGVAVVLLDESGGEVSSVITLAGGQYEFAELEPGSYTVTAAKSGYVNDQGRVVATAGETTTLDFVLVVEQSHGEYTLEYVSGGSNEGDPDQEGVVAKALNEVLSVRLVNETGEPVEFAQMEFAVIDGHSGGAMDGADIVTGPDGEAANGYTLGTLAGENHVRVRSTVGGGFIHFYPQGLAGAPASIAVVSGNEQTGIVGAALAAPLVAEVKDSYKNVVPGATVGFAAANGGSTSPAQIVTNASGQASTAWTLGTALVTLPPQQTLEATCGSAHVTFTATNISRAPSSIVIVSGDGQSARSGQQLPAPFVVRVTDDIGNPGYGYAVAWTTSTGGSVSQGSSSIGQDGLAEARGTMGALQEQSFFATIPGGKYVTFRADKVGDTKVDFTEPALVWPGYPDANAADPAAILVPITIRGTGFGPEATVRWNAGATDAEVLTPVSVSATKLVVNVSADHFKNVGTVPVAVFNTAADSAESFGFKVSHTLLVPSNQDSSLCTKSSNSGWDWADCSEIGPDDEAYGQDGHREERGAGRWAVNGNGTAEDRVTGLSWMRCFAGRVYDPVENSCTGKPSIPETVSKAQAMCSEMDLGGYTDWRVPSLYELWTLTSVDPLDQYYGIDKDIFLESAQLWTSTYLPERQGAPGGYVSFQPWDMFSIPVEPITYSLKALCVRGEPVVSEEYSASQRDGARLVFDGSTGLMWHACPLGTSGSNCLDGTMTVYTWSEALAACNDLDAGGFNDWRLPNMNDLMTLPHQALTPTFSNFFGYGDEEDPAWSVWASSTFYDSFHAPHWIRGEIGYQGKEIPGYYPLGAICVRMGY